MNRIFNKLYKKINSDYAGNYILKKEIEPFKNCDNVLDVGCGEGKFLEKLKRRGEGIDHNKKSLQICRGKKLKVKYGKVTKLPYKSELFDGVHCAHVIEHLNPPEAYRMLSEIGRVLKKNGIFVLYTPLMWDGFYDDFTHIKPYNPKSIERYLCINGEQKTMNNINYKFKKVALIYRFKRLPLPGKIGRLISSMMYKYHFHTLKKNGYTLTLKKIK